MAKKKDSFWDDKYELVRMLASKKDENGNYYSYKELAVLIGRYPYDYMKKMGIEKPDVNSQSKVKFKVNEEQANAYWGDRLDFLITLSKERDSDGNFLTYDEIINRCEGKNPIRYMLKNGILEKKTKFGRREFPWEEKHEFLIELNLRRKDGLLLTHNEIIEACNGRNPIPYMRKVGIFTERDPSSVIDEFWGKHHDFLVGLNLTVDKDGNLLKYRDLIKICKDRFGRDPIRYMKKHKILTPRARESYWDDKYDFLVELNTRKNRYGKLLSQLEMTDACKGRNPVPHMIAFGIYTPRREKK